MRDGEPPSEGNVDSSLWGCPDDSWSGACEHRAVITLDSMGATANADGVTAQPLQITTSFEPDPPPGERSEDPPERWDRGSLPLNSCVFRLQGVPRSCLDARAALWMGGCEQHERVSPPSYYESTNCEQSIAPGCPSGDRWGPEGHWWYLLPSRERDDELSVVICGPLCASVPKGGRLCLAGL